MPQNDAATKQDVNNAVDEITGLINGFINQTANEFEGASKERTSMGQQIQANTKTIQESSEAIQENREDIKTILSHIDHIEKQLEIDDDERLVLGYQIQRLHDWAVEAGKRIGIDFKAH